MTEDHWQHIYSGKVRDLYEDPAGRILLVASDRMSAFDHVLETPIPDKGRILTQLSLWWFEQLSGVVPNHVLSTDVGPTDVPPEFAGRAMVCERLDMVPYECVVRGYLAGSGLADYARTGKVCGVALPPGLVDASELPEPVFTPATKAPLGAHDENVSFDVVVADLGADAAQEIRRTSLAVYARGVALARASGVLVADTKLEWGRRSDGTLVLADEVLTPDSSRFWPADGWRPGRAQLSFDKQYVRDWLVSPASGWDRSGGVAPPALPDEVVDLTRARYLEAYERITGHRFAG